MTVPDSILDHIPMFFRKLVGLPLKPTIVTPLCLFCFEPCVKGHFCWRAQVLAEALKQELRKHVIETTEAK